MKVEVSFLKKKRSLIYLYVENLGDCFNKQEFTFTDKYKVAYEREKSTLYINRNEVNSEIFFEKFNVDKINLIIGENGSGKSTILDALGSTTDFKLGAVNNRRKYKWLAIYEIESESESDNFLLEGYLPPEIKNIKPMNPTKINGKAVINLEKKMFMQIEAIKNNTKESENHYDFKQIKLLEDESEKLVYVYSRLSNDTEVLIDNKREHTDKVSNYERIVSSKPDITDMVDYIDNILALDKTHFRGIGLNIRLSVKDKYYFDGYEIIKNSPKYRERMEQIYGSYYFRENEKVKFNNNEKPKQQFVLNYLETLYVGLNDDGYKKKNFEENRDLISFDFESRKKFLLKSIVKSVDNVLEFENSLNQELIQELYNDLSNRTYNSFEKEMISEFKEIINENTFYVSMNYIMIIMHHLTFLDSITDSNIVTKSEISIPIFQKIEYRKLIRDYLLIMKKIEEINFSPYSKLILFDFKLSSLSSGEIQYIKSFSNIYKSIKNMKTNNYKSCVILLDEPDMNFHPEWSRKFINTLDELLGNFIDRFSFQVIITSHSPFMVSDIPKELITCIHINQEPNSNKIIRTVTQADFGLMSNVYDLLKESFFMKKPIGELANIFFEHLKRDINEISIIDSDSNQHIQKIESIIKRIELVDDPLVKKAITTFMEEQLKRKNMHKNALLKRKERLERELLEIEYEIRKDQ